jgi:hypothetical protein
MLKDVSGLTTLEIFPEDSTPASSVSRTITPAGGGLGVGNYSSDGSLIDWITFGTDGDDALDLQTGTQPTGTNLSNSTASTDSAGDYTGSVSTDTGTDTLYYVVTLTATAPTATQVIAGQNNAGTAAVKAASQAVTATGTQAVSGTGLNADTAYYMHFAQSDGTDDSNVSSTPAFTYYTPAQIVPTPTNLSTTQITKDSAQLSWDRGI